MPKRASALRALELLNNVDDVESGSSDDSDFDFDDDDFESEKESIDSENSSDDKSEVNCDNEIDDQVESGTDQVDALGQSKNEDKTSKAGVIWTLLNDGEETTVRKRINFHEKTRPTRYAATRVDIYCLSAFFAIFNLIMVKIVLECTNVFAPSVDPQCSFSKEEILAFIGVLLARGVFCSGIPVKGMW